jgi:DNA-binding NtrC family response regulator
MAIPDRPDDIDPGDALPMKAPTKSRILIVSENDLEAEGLKSVLLDAGLASESARTITAACEWARAGGFQVIFSSCCLEDGSWRRLIDLAHHYDLNFEVILIARNIGDKEWAEALQLGAFDVVDLLSDLSRAGALARSAVGADYLVRFRPHQKQAA